MFIKVRYVEVHKKASALEELSEQRVELTRYRGGYIGLTAYCNRK